MKTTVNRFTNQANGMDFKLPSLSVNILFSGAESLPVSPAGVAQIGNLPYRRMVFGWAPGAAGGSLWPPPADCQSAIQQISNLRYFIGGCAALGPSVVELRE